MKSLELTDKISGAQKPKGIKMNGQEKRIQAGRVIVTLSALALGTLVTAPPSFGQG
jgi:hypothetical protein